MDLTPLVLALPLFLSATLACGQVAFPDLPTYVCGDNVGGPWAVKKVTPKYPPEAIRRGLEGNVKIELLVNSVGRVIEVHIIRSDNPIFDEPTLTAARQWRYRLPWNKQIRHCYRKHKAIFFRNATVKFSLADEENQKQGLPPHRVGNNPPSRMDGQG